MKPVLRISLRENNEDPRIMGLTRFRCNNWMDLAQAMVKEFGAPAKEVAKRGRYHSADLVAEEIKKSYGTDVQAIYDYYRALLPWQEPVWEMSLEDLPHKMILRTKCLVGECWQERIAQDKECEDLCWTFCSWDDAVARRVNPKIRCDVTKWMGHGYPFCELVWATQDE